LATDDRVFFCPWPMLGRFALGCVLIGALLARLNGRIGIVRLLACNKIDLGHSLCHLGAPRDLDKARDC
jgi:hypothetical protein